MIRRFYVHNFRCLENFELPVAGRSSILLIGKNGAGKTTVLLALEILQKIARGTNRVRDLLAPKDLTRGRTDVPARFEIEAELEGQVYEYAIAFELPEGFKELRVREERLSVDGKPVYTRAEAEVHLSRSGSGTLQGLAKASEAQFRIDWHLVALPIVQAQSKGEPLAIFKDWLGRALILRPVPSMIGGASDQETLQPKIDVVNLAEWFSGTLAYTPAAYGDIQRYLKQVMPDLKDIQNPPVGKDSRSLVVQFSKSEATLRISFEDLSDGEKCFMICALVLAAAEHYPPLLCFWDEPDNYLALSEVGDFVMALRQAFQSGGQFIATSHNPEAIRKFNDENTLVLQRKSHLEPTVVRKLSELHGDGDLVDALVLGDLN